MAASKGSKPGRGKWWALGTIAVAGFLAVETSGLSPNDHRR